ncbi:MAG: hypothetical protein WCA13_07075 [Terriglobales bacterium]
MLTGMRSRFLLSFLLVFSVASCLPVQAQINGVPPSVTSMGFGGRFINGIPPSVTSLGPNGYGSLPFLGGCCTNLFLPANPHPPLFSGHHHRGRKDKDHDFFAVGEPVYVPYAVPYVEDADDDDSPDADYAPAPGERNADPPTKRGVGRESAVNANLAGKPASGGPEEPVAAQPSTVLVFKDGHQSDVRNYAIVGDTLFDFTAGRTRKILLADLDLPATQKANDDRGVDFQIPDSTTP